MEISSSELTEDFVYKTDEYTNKWIIVMQKLSDTSTDEKIKLNFILFNQSNIKSN